MNFKIQLFYKELLLGELEFLNGKYIYNSSSFEQSALKKYKGIVNYNLKNSKNLESDKLFDFFNNYFVNKIRKNKKICNIINFSNEDNDFDILLKYANFRQDEIGFHLKISKTK